MATRSEALTDEERLDWFADTLAATPSRLRDLVLATPTIVFDAPPAADEWSPRQVLDHLVQVEAEVFPSRIEAFVSGEDTMPDVSNHPFDPDATGDDLVARFASLREAAVAQVRALAPDDLDRHMTHATYGDVTLEQMLTYFVAHDLNHLIQIERAIMQPLIPETGPWRPGIESMSMPGRD